MLNIKKKEEKTKNARGFLGVLCASVLLMKFAFNVLKSSPV